MIMKEPPVPITIRPRTVIKVVVVAYTTFGFLKAMDTVLIKHLSPQMDRIIEGTAKKADQALWAEAVKEE